MVPAAPARDTEIAMLPRQITHQNIYRLLIAGFSLVILMLLAAAIVGLRNIQSIQENASNLVHEQDTTRHLVDELRSREKSLAEVFSILARDPDSVDYGRIMSQLAEADRDIERISAEGAHTPQSALWASLRQTSAAFSGEARRILSAENPTSFASLSAFSPRPGPSPGRARPPHRIRLPKCLGRPDADRQPLLPPAGDFRS